MVALQDYRDARKYTALGIIAGLTAVLLAAVLLNRPDLLALFAGLTILGAVLLFVLSVVIVSVEAALEEVAPQLRRTR